MSDSVKKLLFVRIPVSKCNFKCPYCYIGQTNKWGEYNEDLGAIRDTELIRRAFSKERLGGTCYINVCAKGETLIYPEMVQVLRTLLEAGHYLEVITNGTMTKRFEEIAKFPEELLKRIEFKFSFHYTELKRLNLMDVYFENINLIKNAGASFSIELTPVDEEEKYIDDIKKMCLERAGAMCHVTIARDDTKYAVPVLSEHSLDEYYKIWSTFESPMIDFKKTIFQVERKEFCYAGAWSLHINLATGTMSKCYGVPVEENFYDFDVDLDLEAVGRCMLSHCYNGHALVSFGVLPDVDGPAYTDIRNRVREDGTEWLSDEIKSFFSGKLKDNNVRYSKGRERRILFKKNMIDIPKAKLYRLLKGIK